ncbi:MAG: DUF3276 family protein [Bacteroidia bacterium]
MEGRDEVYSKRIRAGKRTYFFDVRSTRSEDFYITITESKRRFNGRGYDKHKIFLYKEDFNKFFNSLEETIGYVKTELLPDYDYEEFDRRMEEEYNNSFDSSYDKQEDREPAPADKEASPTFSSEQDEEINLNTEQLSTRWEE